MEEDSLAFRRKIINSQYCCKSMEIDVINRQFYVTIDSLSIDRYQLTNLKHRLVDYFSDDRFSLIAYAWPLRMYLCHCVLAYRSS